MALLWILLGITVIVLIARYNEDDSLFWKLFVSFIGAYLATYLVLNTFNSGNQSDQNDTEVNPTQVLDHATYTMPSLCMFSEVLTLTPVGIGSNQKLASKDCYNFCANEVALNSKVCAVARDQPFDYFDTS